MTAQPLWNPVGGWTPARIDMLCRHYALGLTAGESAEAIGGVSRNAVISKRLRLGLNTRGATRAGALSGRLAGRGVVGPPPLPCEPLPAMDVAPPADARPSRLGDRGGKECAWPLGPAEQPGDYRTLYCCAPRVGRGSYCADHAERARRRP